MTSLRSLKIGYAAMSPDLGNPGDRRRFVHYARTRGIDFELADLDKDYDLVVLTQAADISQWCRKIGPLIVYDLIDSYLAIPRSDLKGIFRGLAKFASGQSRHLEFDYWKAVGAICARADAVICSTEEQRRDIEAFCSNVHIILDLQSEVGPLAKAKYAAGSPFRLVWEGLPQNLGGFEVIKPVLQRLRAKRAIELVLVTDPIYHRFLTKYVAVDTLTQAQKILSDVMLRPWDGKTIGQDISTCDLAVVPLDLADPFAAGKPENKLLLLWRLGMPVITSATPAYLRAMGLAGLAMTCASEADWEAMLNHYIDDEDARRQAGLAGLACAKSAYSEAATLAKWDALFASLPEKSLASCHDKSSGLTPTLGTLGFGRR